MFNILISKHTGGDMVADIHFIKLTPLAFVYSL